MVCVPTGLRSASAKDFKAGLCGPATWMMLPGHFSEMRKDGNIFEISARYTGGWKKRDANWAIVDKH